MEFTKDLEGQVILARPTGNAARGWKGELTQFEVVKVKRKYAELQQVGWNISFDYTMDTGTRKGAINTGYLFFRSVKDYQHWEWRFTLTGNIEKMTRGFGFSRKIMKCSDEDLRTLERILLKVVDSVD